MNTLRKISMLAIVAGLSLTATGLFAEDGDNDGKRKRKGRGERKGRGNRPEFMKDLSKEDRAKLKEISQSRRKEIQAVMKSDSKDKRAKIEEINSNYGPKTKAIVGEENFKKMQAMHKARMQKRGGKGGKGGRGKMMEGLTDKQKEQLKSLHAEMKKDREASRAKFEAKIKAIVGEEKFEKMKANRKKRGGGGKGGKGGRRRRGEHTEKGHDND